MHVSKSQRDPISECSIKERQLKELTLHVCVRGAIKSHEQPVLKGYSYLNIFHYPFSEIRYKHRRYRPHSQVKVRGGDWILRSLDIGDGGAGYTIK